MLDVTAHLSEAQTLDSFFGMTAVLTSTNDDGCPGETTECGLKDCGQLRIAIRNRWPLFARMLLPLYESRDAPLQRQQITVDVVGFGYAPSATIVLLPCYLCDILAV